MACSRCGFEGHDIESCLEPAPADGSPASSGDSLQTGADGLRRAHEVALASRDPGSIASTVGLVASWIRAENDLDTSHARWLEVQDIFTRLDLSVWERDRSGIATVALALADLDFYRQTDLSTEARFALLTRVRGMLPLTEHLACARVDLERAELASSAGAGQDPSWALTLCDDALGPAQQLASELGPNVFANALLSRGQILGRMRRFDEAISEAKRAEKLYEESGATHSLANVNRLLGEIWAMRDHWPNAQMFLNEAIEKYKDTRDSVGEALSLLARARVWPPQRAHRALSDCNEVVRLCELAKLRATQGEAMLVRGRAQERAASFVEAMRDYHAAAEFLEASPERYAYVLALLSIVTLSARTSRSVDEIRTCIEKAEKAANEINNERVAAIAFLRICKTLQDMPTPDKPGIARNAAVASELAEVCKDSNLQEQANMFLAYSGIGLFPGAEKARA